VTDTFGFQAHSSILQPRAPYYLTERVVTKIGVDVRKYLRRCRATDGSTQVWMGRNARRAAGSAVRLTPETTVRTLAFRRRLSAARQFHHAVIRTKREAPYPKQSG
jgi:hypothetical protein